MKKTQEGRLSNQEIFRRVISERYATLLKGERDRNCDSLRSPTKNFENEKDLDDWVIGGLANYMILDVLSMENQGPTEVENKCIFSFLDC